MIVIDLPERAQARLETKLANKDKVMWFGHRVYQNGDSRVPTIRAAPIDVAFILTGGPPTSSNKRMRTH